jgi:hypothetical protein
MAAAEYRLYLDDEPASREDLDWVDEIVVEQEMDLAWQARLQVPICVDAAGVWSGVDEAFMTSFARIRVELRLDSGRWTPLIDGPVVGIHRRMRSGPGQSVAVVVVRDDSESLNRREATTRFENQADHEIARALFREGPQIASTEIDETPRPPTGQPPVVFQNGTPMQLLRRLAARHPGFHARVRPGTTPGQSIGCFRAVPTEPDGLPPLTLLGPERTATAFDVRHQANRPATVRAATIRLIDKQLVAATARPSAAARLGDEPTVPDRDAGEVLLSPYRDAGIDPQRAAAAEADRSSYSDEATGEVVPGCYGGILEPYRVVPARGVDAQRSGNYLIHRVTHHLTRSRYSQRFVLRRNASSSGAGGGGLGVPEVF